MWTGKRLVWCGVVVIPVLLVACQSKSEDGQPITAWWYNINFEPTSAAVRGIDVHMIDDGWRRATVLDTTLLVSRIPRDDFQRFEASPLSFSLQADLDRDGVDEDFFVGVFETAQGERGSFVAIARNGRPVKHFEATGITGFSALMRGEGEVRWYRCMECGEFESIKWKGNSYVLE